MLTSHYDMRRITNPSVYSYTVAPLNVSARQSAVIDLIQFLRLTGALFASYKILIRY